MIYKVKGSKKGSIFCIHGNSSSAEVFEILLKTNKLLQNKIAVDLNGHGNNQNENDQLTDYALESYKKFILNEISKIDDEILLIGNSLGGHIAIEIAHKIKKLKGLIIMGTPPVKKPINFEEAFNPIEALHTFLTENPTDNEIMEALEIAVQDKSKIPEALNTFKKSNPLVRKATALDIQEGKFHNQYNLFTTLDLPKFIIAGDYDPSVNREYLEVVKSNNVNGSCEIIEVADCGHFPSLDQPHAFVDIVYNIANKIF